MMRKIAAAALVVGITVLNPAGLVAADPPVPAPKSSSAEGMKTYAIDPMHTSVSFEIVHMGLSRTVGRFTKVSGTIHEDEKDLTKASVEFKAEVDSLDTDAPPRDEHLKKPEFFDAIKFPELTFKSTGVTKAKEGYVVTGNLTMKGMSKSISIPFTHHGPLSIKGMEDQPARIGVIAEPVTIKRTDFGVGTNDKLPDGTVGASDEVTVRISMEATLEK